VLLEGSRTRAILVGTNGPLPKLIYWSGGAPREGERVVTAGEAGAFPPDLLIGTVHYTAGHVAEVVPAADLDRLEMVRIVDDGTPAAGAAGAATPVLPPGV